MNYIYLVKAQHLQEDDYRNNHFDVDVHNAYWTVERQLAGGDYYHWLSLDRPVKGRYYLAQTEYGAKVVEVVNYVKVDIRNYTDAQLFFAEKYGVSMKFIICLLPKKAKGFIEFTETWGIKDFIPSQYAWNKVEALFNKKGGKVQD